jgi:hypothetical protein
MFRLPRDFNVSSEKEPNSQLSSQDFASNTAWKLNTLKARVLTVPLPACGPIGRWKLQGMGPGGRKLGHWGHVFEEGCGTNYLILSLLPSHHEISSVTCSLPEQVTRGKTSETMSQNKSSSFQLFLRYFVTATES